MQLPARTVVFQCACWSIKPYHTRYDMGVLYTYTQESVKGYRYLSLHSFSAMEAVPVVLQKSAVGLWDPCKLSPQNCGALNICLIH